MNALVLHNYFRSSSSVRVRAALNLKGLAYDYVAYHLRKGEQQSAAYLETNPQGLVPALATDDGDVITQSLAIIEFLDETHPEPPLLPGEAKARARVRSISQAIACEIHPLNNLRVLQYLENVGRFSTEAAADWFRHWVRTVFAPLERSLAGDPRTGRFCHGDAPTMADLCLYAQVLNNRRFAIDLADYPTIKRIFDACSAVPAIAMAAPENQPDRE